MSAIAVTAAQVAPVFTRESRIRPIKLAEAVTAGQSLYRTTAGLAGLAGAAAAGKQEFIGIALNTKAAGEVVNALEEGEVYGFDLSGLNADAMVYQSDTLGALDTAAGTKTVCVGRVVVLTEPGSPKVLRIYALPALKR